METSRDKGVPDGFVRAGKIRTSSHKTNRPLAKLYPLQVNMSEEQGVSKCTRTDSNPGDETTDDDTPPVNGRATRDAAIWARSLIKNWTNTIFVALEDVKN